MQLSIVISMAVSYVVWGIVHHHEHRSLHAKIILEYLLIAVFAVLLFGSILLRT
jgi:hypothetical protein